MWLIIYSATVITAGFICLSDGKMDVLDFASITLMAFVLFMMWGVAFKAKGK